MKRFAFCFSVLALATLLVTTTRADVFNMADGATSLEMVPVGNLGNTPDTAVMTQDGTTGYGAVDYAYNIGKYEVTNSQYCEFLNAVARSDPNSLYDAHMGGGWNNTGGISRSGSDGSYTYSVRTNRGNHPVNYVRWFDTLRFANWLHNGQPTGAQYDTTTEDGAYDMSLGSSVVRKPGAQVFLPSEDEWYKAAYYKGGGTNAGYWGFPTQSGVLNAPTSEVPPGTDMTNGSANYKDGFYVDDTYYTTEVGAYDARPSDSAYGTYDQGGNLSEWNETFIRYVTSFTYRGVRGGSWNGAFRNLHASWRSSANQMGEGPSLGFRVASVPEPGSITLLVSGAFGLLAYGGRRRKR